MHCPICNAQNTNVIDSRMLLEGQTVRRRRKCGQCENRFTTYEKIHIQIPIILKNDGRRENFSREKIFGGLKKAAYKRPVTMDELNHLVDLLENHLADNFSNEAPSHSIGLFLMKHLYNLDVVSYVRFASFYWDFKDIESFTEALVTNAHQIQNKDILSELHQ